MVVDDKILFDIICYEVRAMKQPHILEEGCLTLSTLDKTIQPH